MLSKLHLYVMLSFGDSFYPADTDISCGFALLNDVQAAVIFVSLRSLTKKSQIRPKVVAGYPFRIYFCIISERQSWCSDKQGQIITLHFMLNNR